MTWGEGGLGLDGNTRAQHTGERNLGLVGGLDAPLDHADFRVGGKRSVEALEADNVVAGKALLVNVGVGLKRGLLSTKEKQLGYPLHTW